MRILIDSINTQLLFLDNILKIYNALRTVYILVDTV
jgi:hypothetical protein